MINEVTHTKSLMDALFLHCLHLLLFNVLILANVLVL